MDPDRRHRHARLACGLLGANGAGKTTFLKLLVGDLELEAEQGHKGEAWRHHNLRVSYIAQHSLHHLEEYLNETPLHYIQERFRLGMDKELAKLKTMALTEDEKALMTDIGMVCEVTGRQQRGKAIWYEVVKTGRKKSDTQYFPLDEIKKDTVRFPPYVMKLIRNYDEKQAAIDSGMAIRPITSTEILAHLADFGIPMELAHGKIKQMSGGQRQRLVICAAFWSKPHLIALDEPTNYLDNDTLAALTQALKTFKGAVVTVSHNEAFVAEISNEKWIVEGNPAYSCATRRRGERRGQPRPQPRDGVRRRLFCLSVCVISVRELVGWLALHAVSAPRGPAWTRVDRRRTDATARRVPAVDESVRLSTAERFPRLSTMNQCRGSHARRRSRAVGTNVEKKVEWLKYTLLCQIKALED